MGVHANPGTFLFQDKYRYNLCQDKGNICSQPEGNLQALLKSMANLPLNFSEAKILSWSFRSIFGSLTTCTASCKAHLFVSFRVGLATVACVPQVTWGASVCSMMENGVGTGSIVADRSWNRKQSGRLAKEHSAES